MSKNRKNWPRERVAAWDDSKSERVYIIRKLDDDGHWLVRYANGEFPQHEDWLVPVKD